MSVINIVITFIGSLITFYTSYKLIPVFMPMTEKAGLWGKDLCKKGLPNEDKKMYSLIYFVFIIVLSP